MVLYVYFDKAHPREFWMSRAIGIKTCEWHLEMLHGILLRDRLKAGSSPMPGSRQLRASLVGRKREGFQGDIAPAERPGHSFQIRVQLGLRFEGDNSSLVSRLAAHPMGIGTTVSPHIDDRRPGKVER